MKPRVLITGIAGGIGKATAGAFSRAGWEIIGVDREKEGVGSEVNRFFHGDLSDPVFTEGLFDEISAGDISLRALVNNAAIQISKPFTATSTEDWNRLMDTNLNSVFRITRKAIPLFPATGGTIVNVSSVHASATSVNISAYAASKGALSALTRALAVELAEKGIRVNAVAPGAVDTKMLREGLVRGHLGSGRVEEALKELSGRTVMGRIGRPEEIAEAILFLSDDKRSSFITGQVIT
ncbi:MAG TPA: SDR family oxidoreductase, partial [Nitrospiria bacterium]